MFQAASGAQPGWPPAAKAAAAVVATQRLVWPKTPWRVMIQRAEPVGLQARSFATMVLPLPRGRVDPAAVVEVHSPTLEIPPIIQVGVAAEPEGLLARLFGPRRR